MTNYFKSLTDRIAVVKMLHIGLQTKWWNWMEIVYVLTGRVI